MAETELDRAIATALQTLSHSNAISGTANDSYIKAFTASAQRKAETVLALLNNGTFPAKRPVFVSVGGGDGEELAYLLEHSSAIHGVLLELSRDFAERARKRLISDGKTIHVFEGTAQSRIAKAMEFAANLIQKNEGDALIVTCHAVIHELYDRGSEEFDALSFFGPIFKYRDIPTGFTYREPGDVTNLPEQLLISADCNPDSLFNLAQVIRNRHPKSLGILRPEPQVIAGESLRLHRKLGLEVLAKLFYLEDLPHEIEERLTAIDHSALNNAIHTAVGETAIGANQLIVKTQSDSTDSYVEKWKSLKVRVEGYENGKPEWRLPVPEFQKRTIVWRDSLRASSPNSPQLTTATPANYDLQFPPFNVPYSPKGDRVIGRTEGLEKVREQLTRGRRTSIGQTASFNGLGGLGKTQLAVEYAWEYRKSYPNGVIWIEADQDIDSQLTSLAVKARWVAEESEHRYKLDIALKRLRSFSNCLIIFDNVENRKVIEPYLPEPGASPHLLITSREPQPGFEALPIALLDEDQSLNLLYQEAGREAQNSDDIWAAREIVKKLDGLPLAIEIAGAYLHEMSTITFVEFWKLLNRDPQIHVGQDYLASFTRHEADLDATLRISDQAFEKQPLLRSILEILTWSGAAAMGSSLMSYMLKVDPLDLVDPLAFGARLHLLKEELTAAGPNTERRYRIHRLIREIRRAKDPIAKSPDRVAELAERVGDWFEKRRLNFHDLSQYESEFDHLREWQENASQFAQGSAIRLLWLQAYPAWHRGSYAESQRLLEMAIERLDQNEITELQGHLLNDLGNVLKLLGDNQNAFKFLSQSLVIRQRLVGEKHFDTAITYANLSNACANMRNGRLALQYAESALAIELELRGPKHPSTARAQGMVGAAYHAKGDYENALIFKRKALALYLETVGESHPETAFAYVSLSGTYLSQHNYQLALEYAEKSLAIRRRILGEMHPQTGISYNNVAAAFGFLDNHRQALDFHERSLDITTSTLGSRNPERVKCLIAVALELEKNNRPRDSFALIQSALRTLQDNHQLLPNLREVKTHLIQKYPRLKDLASAHPPKKPRNRKRR